jgi:dihydrofolate synthase / folylpolyglutamate synthase
MLSYSTAVERLYALGHELARTPAHKFDLAHMRVLVEALGHPERRFASVLIAGTNGKGSTAAMLASIAQAAGHRTGLYTSPHLVRINERIRVGGQPIDDAALAAAYERVDAVAQQLVARGELPHAPSFFETLTAMAFEHFAGAGVELAIAEVGMGGRLDATNVIEPVVAVITDIALDHQKFLGETIAEIAQEKAGIIHRGATVVLLPQHPHANDVLGRAVEEREARAVSAVPYMASVSPESTAAHGNGAGAGAQPRNRYPLSVLGEEIAVDSPLFGHHQLRNTALAIAAAVELNAAGFAIGARDVERGIAATRWPGRLQLVRGTPDVLLDVAHNPAGAWVLRAALSERFGARPLTFVFGAMRDKAITEMADILFPLAARVVATPAANPRSATADEIAAAGARTGAEIVTAPNVAAALARARELAPSGGLIVVTGSIYVVGEVLMEMGVPSF